ncbi:hypothetical protein [Bacillus glycinifermentans]|uniref:Polymer-forming cytoskeletal protein n=1 Tax=Bacillus glycinifermentans TaxID=1664069 RepID=A0A0T6BLV9_9BACI|nr:hypothetical protein [Bacillus glycinifermentans]ATH94824.1 hypothetical protein COP00_21480 [Bacillus glycinifermentans]KRT92158.1 hypothetical protein AB447_204390 [Bacillus glycinifermentans]MEC0486840.1 hypothetical protein [Bacillus glycinifermentans]MEC3606243.1 hypothetical protein [Bacillus glycinifermentans]UOY88304.1 hypothetical protein MW696_20210 [Bacillus glycinifermentans]
MEGNNLKINGSGSAAGGTYHNVVIKGEGTIGAGLDCAKFRCYGTSVLSGDAKVQSLHIYGEAEVAGRLKADKAKIYGTAEISGNADISETAVKGILTVGGNLTGDECDIKGTVAVKGDCEAERFTLNGNLEIDGLLNAGEVDVALRFGESSVGEIGGTAIKVRNKRGLFKKNSGFLSAKVIEGDDIYLENTSAGIVRGNRVRIGPGCRIETVEYNSDYHVSDKAEVKENRQI